VSARVEVRILKQEDKMAGAGGGEKMSTGKGSGNKKKRE
jgi:hypothetical protein